MRLPIRGERLDTLLRSVDRASSQFDVDPVSVLAVILVESRFDSGAVSPRGAMGLMQLRADTARELADELGVHWTSDDLLLDPDTNVLLGTYYLSVLFHRFGDQDAAFTAFHAGPGRVAGGEALPRDYADRVWDAVVRLRVRPFA
jgi:soluble lytic murein transglycosylase